MQSRALPLQGKWFWGPRVDYGAGAAGPAIKGYIVSDKKHSWIKGKKVACADELDTLQFAPWDKLRIMCAKSHFSVAKFAIIRFGRVFPRVHRPMPG